MFSSHFIDFFVSLSLDMKHLHPLYSEIAPPERFTYPFCYEPHPLCQLAAKEVQAYIASHTEIKEDADRGKMFGVLVVEANTHHLTPNTPSSPPTLPLVYAKTPKAASTGLDAL